MPDSLIAGRYEVRDRIGRGSHAVVLEAYDRRLSRLVALKVVRHRSCDEGTEILARFEREARIVARLSHPGIVPVHDFGHGPDYTWLAMELVIGASLERVLAEHGRLQVAEAVRITTELLQALGHAHDRGIVHRDVKPANLLLSEGMARGLGTVRVTDFGVAHLGARSSADITFGGQMLGTPATMAPEQVCGAPPDPRMDLWAAGTVLYRMLTGRRPFERGNVYATLHAIQSDEAPPPSASVPGLPMALDAVIARALRKNPSERFPDAAGMIAALRLAASAAIRLPIGLRAAAGDATRAGPQAVGRRRKPGSSGGSAKLSRMTSTRASVGP